MGKTPYELRFELLQMAQSIITENLMNERIKLENNWHMLKEIHLYNMSEGRRGTPVPFPEVPKINPDDIIRMAQQLNGFISKDS